MTNKIGTLNIWQDGVRMKAALTIGGVSVPLNDFKLEAGVPDCCIGLVTVSIHGHMLEIAGKPTDLAQSSKEG